MILIRNKEEVELVKNLRALGDVGTAAEKHKRILELEKQIADLEIQKSRKQESFEKQERELRHMIGLERKRQEFEIEKATSEVSIKVREEALKAEQKRFAEQLAFNTERFNKAEENLKSILGEIIQRLPNVNMEVTRKSR